MDWSSPIDLYCERDDASFWAEPTNALTNAAFLIAAAAAFLLWRRAGGRDWQALALIVVVVAVGLGSFTFHTVATRGAMLADVIPIAIFIYGYLLLALRRFLQLPAGAAIAIVVAYAAGAQALSWLAPSALNGSISYLPALVAMAVMARVTRGQPRRSLEPAVMIFTVSLGLRTIDLAACETFPIGTHFVWHLLNAVVLYVLLRSAITESDSKTAASARPGNS
ncbi:MAG TPA: ceramidase domain-containing protein [Xanthobacteraceae bacterium]|nr:ceramidase domain-containing protein [Xanthobacteraceae bacterium]